MARDPGTAMAASRLEGSCAGWSLPALCVVLAATTLGGCSSLGRKVNQALPEFLRADPGQKEVDRYQQRVRVLNRTKEEVEAARRAFAEAQRLFDAEQFEDSYDALEAYLETYPDTADDKEARFLLIRAALGDEEYSDAQRAITAFLRNYPISNYNNRVEEIIYELAVEYLAGDHDDFIFSNEGEGLRLLEQLVLNFPNGQYADDAQWRLGRYHFEEDKYIEAEAAFAAIVETYPESPWVGSAQFNRGVCRLRRVKGPDYDEQNMIAARNDFRRYLELAPEGDKRELALHNVAQLENLLCEKQIQIAEWYLGRDFPGAARFYLVRALERHGNTEAATQARALLEALPQDVDSFDFAHTPGADVPAGAPPVDPAADGVKK